MTPDQPILSGLHTGEVLAVEVLITHERKNARMLHLASITIFVLGAIFFAVSYHNRAIIEPGPALGNLLTVVSGLFPVSRLSAVNSRIGELEAAKILASQLARTPDEEELFRQLIKN